MTNNFIEYLLAVTSPQSAWQEVITDAEAKPLLENPQFNSKQKKFLIDLQAAQDVEPKGNLLSEEEVNQLRQKHPQLTREFFKKSLTWSGLDARFETRWFTDIAFSGVQNKFNDTLHHQNQNWIKLAHLFGLETSLLKIFEAVDHKTQENNHGEL